MIAELAQSGCDIFCAGTHKCLFAPRGTGFIWAPADRWARLRPRVSSFESRDTYGAWIEEARRKAETRSRIIEIWLQLAARRRAARELEEATIQYYQQRTESQRQDDEGWSSLSARAGRKLSVDAAPPKARPRRGR